MNLFDRRRILASIGGIFKKIVSGASGIVNYVTNVAMPTKITCEFSPVQSGTGDPSPSNVRPISGWAGANVCAATAKTISFSLRQEGSGTASPTNIRPIVPGLSFERDDGTVLNAYTGELALNSDGTSTVTETVIAKCFDGVNLKVTKNTYLTGNWIRAGWVYASPVSNIRSGILCDRLSVSTTASIAEYCLQYAPSGKMYFLVVLTNNASEEGVTSSNVVSYVNDWFIDNPVTFTYKPDTPRTYILSATETQRALTALGEQANSLAVNWAEYEISPIQSGTGDPSPSNVRPITPGLSITRDDSTTLDIYGGTLTLNNDGTSALVKTHEIYSLTGSETWYSYSSTSLQGFRTARPSGTASGQTGVISNIVPTSNGTNVAGIRISSGSLYIYGAVQLWGIENTATAMKNKVAEFANNGTPLTFVAKLNEPVTYTLSAAETQRALVALNAENKIIYGGTLTVNEDGTGTLTQTFQAYEMGASARTWTLDEKSIFYSNFGGIKTYSAGASIVGSVFCDSYKPTSAHTLAQLRKNMENGEIWARSSNTYLHVRDTNYATAADFKASVQGKYVAVRLATPVIYNLTASQVNSLVGNNTTWHDMNGTITVEYYKKD